MKTPYDKFAKIYTNCCENMTKMAAEIPIYFENPLKNLLLQNQKADDLRTWYVTFEMLGIPSLFK